jgi:enoyl-CoA hydratase/carnithine racemase
LAGFLPRQYGPEEIRIGLVSRRDERLGKVTIEMTSELPLLHTVEDGVGLITFNRPERNNAFTEEMNRLFDEAMIAFEQDRSVRAVVITGTGDGFCVGSDMVSLKQTSEAGKSEGFPHPERPFAKYDVFRDAPPELRSRFVLPKAMSKPVIAAVNGRCAGIGLSMAVSSDVRFASSDALFSAIFARRGLTAETGIAYLLLELIGAGATADMLLSGRKVFAEEALAIGLVNRVISPDELLPSALEYARDIAANVSPQLNPSDQAPDLARAAPQLHGGRQSGLS